ncbi:aldo/keto reductase [Novosphingobium tardum]|uniref:Aldo/keto reductase n=1 Tax=Novosphingobium tardum TaxID=1538021 RepID=A0ABV8RQ54_9SPHN
MTIAGPAAHPAIGGLPLVLGGNVFGWTADREASFAILDAFREAGGRMIDTAEAYSAWVPGHKGGESETVLGEWFADRGCRSDMLVATKTNVLGEAGGLAPGKVTAHLDGSLRRLQTDYVDLFYAHRDDPETPQEDVAGGFDALIRAGKVREAGASNFRSERLAGALTAADAVGAARYGVLQNRYNLVARKEYEGPLQELCVAEGVALLPYYGLASGYLTGKYRTKEDLGQSPRGTTLTGLLEQGAPVLAVMDRIAAETGASHAAIALAWINAQPGVAAPIASVSRVEQLDQLIEGARLKLDDAHLAALTAAGAG